MTPPVTPNDHRSYTTVEVAKRLGVSLQTVQRWVDAGHLKAWKTLGGHRRIDAESAEQLFKAQAHRIGTSSDLKPPVLVSVVVVDDDAADRTLMVELVGLALPEARVEVAENGFQALALIGKVSPDIVVTDIHMPHMDGFEMVRQMMVNEFMRPKALIAVSANSAHELASLGQLPPGVQLFAKPIDPARFVAALRLGLGPA